MPISTRRLDATDDFPFNFRSRVIKIFLLWLCVIPWFIENMESMTSYTYCQLELGMSYRLRKTLMGISKIVVPAIRVTVDNWAEKPDDP